MIDDFNQYDALVQNNLIGGMFFHQVDIPVTAFHEVLKANQPSKPTKMLNAKFEFMEEMVSKAL